MEISIPRSDPHPPHGGMEIYNLFFLSFWHHSEQLWKNFAQMRVDPPLKIEKIFFAFLDELDHSTHFKNCMEIDLGLTPTPPTGMEISIHFFFSYFV